MDLGLQGQTAIVTGVSKGRGTLGKAIAEEFAAEGANVVICARGREALEQLALEMSKRHSATILPVAVDLTSLKGIKTLVGEARARFGRIDVLVNCAGNVSADPKPAGSEDDGLEDDWGLKPFGYVRLSREVFPIMVEQGGGRIINVVGLSGREPGRRRAQAANPEWRIAAEAYGSSSRSFPTGGMANAAVLNFTKALSFHGAPHNILVNAINPSYTRSGLEGFLERAAAQTGRPLAELVDVQAKKLLLGRAGSAEDIAAMAVFLASKRASYITGAVMDVDGGERYGY